MASTTQRRPRSSKVNVMGLMMSGSLAKSFDAEVRGRLHELLRLIGRERQLKLRRIGPILVVRHVEAVEVRDTGHLELLPASTPALVDGPDDAALDQILEDGISPRSLVVAIRRVEDTTLALRFQPGPGLTSLCVDALHDHRAFRLGSRRQRLFPCGEWLESLHDRVRGLDDLGGEFRRPLRLQGRADQRHVTDRVQRDKAVPGPDEGVEGLVQAGLCRQPVAVNHDRVVIRQLRGVERFARGAAVGELNAAARQRGREQREHLRGIVWRVFVAANKEHLDRSALFSRCRGLRGTRRRRLARLGQQRQAAEREHASAGHRRPRKSQPKKRTYPPPPTFREKKFPPPPPPPGGNEGRLRGFLLPPPGQFFQTAPAVVKDHQ